MQNYILKELKLHDKLALLVESESAIDFSLDIIEVFKKKSIDFKLIRLKPDGLTLLNRNLWNGINRVFIAISENHSLYTGHIQAILDILGLDYTGTGMLSAALTKDIIKLKKIWQMMGISTTPFIKWRENFDWQEMLGLIGLPMAIKSSNMNNKQVFKVDNLENIQDILKKFDYANDIIIEPWITGEEYVVYIINNNPLVPIKVNSSRGRVFSKFNANISHTVYFDQPMANQSLEEIEINDIKNMQKLALEAFLAIGGQGFAKVNILKDLNADCWVSSINIGLNLTRNSDFAIAAYKSGITFEALIDQILATSFVKKSCNNLIQLV